ncbi:unnamed protein product [Cuscuta epithymum]|uniref:Uncharacterized protein n=1 Tax=Cuscuta epithymum TaxID=186058 RepID=A0AAV0C3L6_9ASTE|nr:unnamed protein product [Cuscuta epithymum]
MSGALTSLCRVTRVRTFPSNSFYARFLPRFSCDICAMKLLEYTSQAFSPAEAHKFFTEENWDSFTETFGNFMVEASKEWIKTNEGSSLMETLRKALDEAVQLSECEVYSYNPEAEFYENGILWAHHFFFYNKKMKRIVSFCFSRVRTLALADDLNNEED